MGKKLLSVVIKESSDSNDSTFKVSIPILLLKKSLKLNRKISGKLKVGCAECNVKFQTGQDESSIELSKSLMKAFGLYDGLKCHVRMENKTLSIGPVVGVFISKHSIVRANNQITTEKMHQYIRANESAQCILYFFCIDDINLIHRRINGTLYNQVNKSWEKRSFPLPDVLYDRGGSRSKKHRNTTKYIQDQLNKLKSLKKINAQSYFNKFDLHKELSKYKDMRAHLPVTKSYSKKRLRKLLTTTKTIYIKARIGSNGKQIMKIQKESDRLYKYSTARNNIQYKIANSFDEMVYVIDNFFKERELIIQTAIDLVEVKNCITDMRATLQRDGEGKLVIITYVVRVAKPKSPVTSTASGSQVYSFDDFYKKLMHFSDEEIVKAKSVIENFLIKVYTRLEDCYGTFGEIGIDFGIDKKGQLWFIESNAKPAKSTIYKLKKDHILFESYLNPFNYAKYLASF